MAELSHLRSTRGFVTVAQLAAPAMITLRGAPATLAPALAQVAGLDWPAARSRVTQGDRALLWMSPDEGLLTLPRADAPAVMAGLAQALAGQFATLADVSDARAVFQIAGAGWRDALAKLCPVDFATLRQDEVRRTRAAQVAVALWCEGNDQVTLVCFASVADYMFAALSNAAQPGSAPGLYR